MAMVSGPNWETDRDRWENHPGLRLMEWGAVCDRTKSFYTHYRALLEADVKHEDFQAMREEVARTREVLEDGAYRGPELRRRGLGSQYSAGEEAGRNPESSEQPDIEDTLDQA